MVQSWFLACNTCRVQAAPLDVNQKEFFAAESSMFLGYFATVSEKASLDGCGSTWMQLRLEAMAMELPTISSLADE